MATTPQFVATPHVALTKFVTADGTNYKTVFTPASAGSRVLALTITSDDTASLQFHISLVKDSVRYKIDTVTVAGATVIQPTTNVNVLDATWLQWLDQSEPHLLLPDGVTLEIAPVAAVTDGREASVIVLAGDF